MPVFWEKVVWTVLAVGMWALSQWPPMAGVELALTTAAGAVFGKVWLPTPEQARAAKAAKSWPPPDRA